MKRLIGVYVLAAVLISWCGAVFAAVPPVAQNKPWEVGLEAYSYEYEEPSIMENEGVFTGLAASYTYLTHSQMYKFEGRFAGSRVDYSSPNSGKIENIDDIVFEARGLIGYDLINEAMGARSDTLSLIPYIGLGFRYLNDDSSGKISSTGAYGYERESRYFYSPVGIELTKYFVSEYSMGAFWSIGFTGEYDIFWAGRQNSYLRKVDPNYGDLHNKQDSGYGWRASVRVCMHTSGVDLVIEPFYRYWNIDRSDDANLTYAGFIWGYGYEPKNSTDEIGCKVAVKF